MITMAKTFADKLNAVLDKRGISQADLARMAGLSTAVIAQVTTGRTKDPRFTTVVKIAVALDLPLEYFATEPRRIKKQ